MWLGPVFRIPGVGSLPFICQLLFAFVENVFMRLGALTVSLQFFGSMDSVARSCLPRPWHFPVLPLDCLFRFAHSLSSGLPIVLWWGPGCFRRLPSCPTLPHVRELQAMSRCVPFLLLASVSLLLLLVAKSEFPSHPLPRSFLGPSHSDFATGLSVASFFCPVRP